ncbi:MAG: hypothetical protein ABJP66_06305, partial [Hyphomicrobiales bacterium]
RHEAAAAGYPARRHKDHLDRDAGQQTRNHRPTDELSISQLLNQQYRREAVILSAPIVCSRPSIRNQR